MRDIFIPHNEEAVAAGHCHMWAISMQHARGRFIPQKCMPHTEEAVAAVAHALGLASIFHVIFNIGHMRPWLFEHRPSSPGARRCGAHLHIAMAPFGVGGVAPIGGGFWSHREGGHGLTWPHLTLKWRSNEGK